MDHHAYDAADGDRSRLYESAQQKNGSRGSMAGDAIYHIGLDPPQQLVSDISIHIKKRPLWGAEHVYFYGALLPVSGSGADLWSRDQSSRRKEETEPASEKCEETKHVDHRMRGARKSISGGSFAFL